LTEDNKMNADFKQLHKRLQAAEAAHKTKPPQSRIMASALDRVDTEALKDLSPEEAELYRSASNAPREDRFHTRAEAAALKKHRTAWLAAVERLGFPSLGAAVTRSFGIRRPPTPDEWKAIMGAFHWAQLNRRHLQNLAAAQPTSERHPSEPPAERSTNVDPA
jgi:hypothetical protein